MISLKRNWLLKLVFFVLLVYLYYTLTKQNENVSKTINDNRKLNDSDGKNTINNTPESFKSTIIRDMVLAVVACGERLEETLTMLKSCLLFSSKYNLKFIVIADDILVSEFKETLSSWQRILNGSFQYEVLPLKFPEKNADEWRKLFKPCASQRLFLPSILTHVDSLIYVDTDTLFLSSIDTLWKHFTKFNASHMAALAFEHEDPNVSWYSRFAKHPYYGKLGVNSGVMLMNLTRMREFNWEKYVTSVYNQWRTQLTWGDQDIINIIFHYHPEKLYLLDCDANYRPDQCTYGPACPTAVKLGAQVLHGSRSAFHSSNQPAFNAIHKAAREYILGTDPLENFLVPMLNNLRSAPESNCGKIEDAFIKLPKQYFEKKT